MWLYAIWGRLHLELRAFGPDTSRALRMTNPSVVRHRKKGWREDESSGKLHTSLRPWARAMRFPGAEPRPPAPQTRPRRAGQGFQFPPPRCEMTDEKEKLLAAAISQIEKDHGKGAIMRLGSRDILVPVSVIPSGCLSIDA